MVLAMIQRYDNASGVSMSVDFKRHHYPIAVSLSNFGTTRYHLTRKRMAFCSLSDMAELTYELGQEEKQIRTNPAAQTTALLKEVLGRK